MRAPSWASDVLHRVFLRTRAVKLRYIPRYVRGGTQLYISHSGHARRGCSSHRNRCQRTAPVQCALHCKCIIFSNSSSRVAALIQLGPSLITGYQERRSWYLKSFIYGLNLFGWFSLVVRRSPPSSASTGLPGAIGRIPPPCPHPTSAGLRRLTYGHGAGPSLRTFLARRAHLPRTS